MGALSPFLVIARIRVLDFKFDTVPHHPGHGGPGSCVAWSDLEFYGQSKLNNINGVEQTCSVFLLKLTDF